MFFCEYCEIFKNNFFIEHLWQLILFVQKQPLEVFCKKVVLKSFAKFTGKNVRQSLAQVFSCKFWEISKNTFFAEHLRATASAHNYHDTWQNINMSAKEIQFFPN